MNYRAPVQKYCEVPQCESTSWKHPEKLFIYVPNDKSVRKKWFDLARGHMPPVSVNTSIFFCEDHFDLPNDMENYIKYRVMGSVSHIPMKPGCIPTKFESQPDTRKQTSDTAESMEDIAKKQRKELIEEILRDNEESNGCSQYLEQGETSAENSVLLGIPKNDTEEEQQVHKTADKAIQVFITHKFRSKATQTGFIPLPVNQATPVKPDLLSVATSSFTATTCASSKPSTSAVQKPSGRLFTIEEQSDSDITFTPSQRSTELSPTTSLQIKTSDCSELMELEKKDQESKILECSLHKIMKNPRSYIGVPKSCYFLIDFIHQTTSIPMNHILMCLKKIRLNNPFRELADDFSMCPTYASKIFLKNIPLLASVMHPFIVELNKLFI